MNIRLLISALVFMFLAHTAKAADTGYSVAKACFRTGHFWPPHSMLHYSKEMNPAWVDLANREFKNPVSTDSIYRDMRVCSPEKIGSTSKFIGYIVDLAILVGASAFIGVPYLTYKNIKSLLSKTEAKPNKGVVLIHGTTPLVEYQWSIAEAYLWSGDTSRLAAGRESIGAVRTVHFDYSKSVEDSCQIVWQQIRDMFSNDANITLVGHSQGGLIARALIDHPTCSKAAVKGPKISKAFLLNALQKGSPAQCYANELGDFDDASGKDMAVGSQFTEDLRRGIDASQSQVEIHEIVGTNDLMVDPCVALTNVPDERVYFNHGSHLLSAVDVELWFGYILPKI